MLEPEGVGTDREELLGFDEVEEPVDHVDNEEPEGEESWAPLLFEELGDVAGGLEAALTGGHVGGVGVSSGVVAVAAGV